MQGMRPFFHRNNGHDSYQERKSWGLDQHSESPPVEPRRPQTREPLKNCRSGLIDDQAFLPKRIILSYHIEIYAI